MKVFVGATLWLALVFLPILIQGCQGSTQPSSKARPVQQDTGLAIERASVSPDTPSADSAETQSDQSTSESRAIHQAAADGDLGLVAKLLRTAPQLADARGDGGSTPLHVAAHMGHRAIAELLLQHGADPTAQDSLGYTPLHYTAGARRFDVLERRFRELGVTDNVLIDVENIIRSGNTEEIGKVIQNIGIQNLDLETILTGTEVSPQVERDKAAIATALLEAGADVNVANSFGETPLHRATMSSRGRTAEILLSAGADPNVQNIAGQTPLVLASVWGEESVIRLLLVKSTDIDVNSKDVYGNSALKYASGRGEKNVVRLFLERDADINIKDDNGWGPLAIASSAGRTEMVKLLLAEGSDVNATDNAGFTPLNTATEHGKIDVVRLLLDYGAEIDTQEKRGNTPLINAATAGFRDVVGLLLDRGANREFKGQHNGTPLHAAAASGWTSVVKLLLARNAEVNSVSDKLGTPLHAWALGKQIATQMPSFEAEKGFRVERDIPTPQDYLDTGKLLINGGADIAAKNQNGDTQLHKVASVGDQAAVRLLLAHGATVDDTNQWGNTPLHMVAYNSGDTETARLLLAAGANIEARNKSGSPTHRATPLLAASVAGKAELVELLLDQGTNPRATVEKGGTALHFAAWKGHIDILKSLVSGGAIVNARDNDGNTALSVAEHYGHAKLAQLLRSLGGTH